jgi:hypothetical protein
MPLTQHLQHASYNVKLGMAGSLLLLRKSTARELLKHPDIQRALKAEVLAIIVWVSSASYFYTILHHITMWLLVLQFNLFAGVEGVTE